MIKHETSGKNHWEQFAFAAAVAGIGIFNANHDSVVQPLTVAANDLAGHLPLKGEVNGNGVYGYTTDYVCYDGAKETQHAVQNGWHITLKNTYFSHNVTWVECWDSDDGDYYGWIDLNFVTIYSTNNPSSGSSPVTITSISSKGTSCRKRCLWLCF